MATTPAHNAFAHFASIRRSVCDRPDFSWRLAASIGLLVVLADACVYSARGYAGPAAVLILGPLCLALGRSRPAHPSVWCLLPLTWWAAARLVWCGFPGALAAGGFCLLATALAIAGRLPLVLRVIALAPLALANGGLLLLVGGERLGRRRGLRISVYHWLAWLVPAAAILAFGLLFLLANPDLWRSVGDWLGRALAEIDRWLKEVPWARIEFWAFNGVLWLGLLRPVLPREVSPRASQDCAAPADQSPFFAACRNTLWAVIVLFSIYLGFEFLTLWFRTFPPGFHYSGYAHRGAFWLTVALALATCVLSAIFQARTLRDPRAARLKRLAHAWSALNLLLAVAVYHRLLIYVQFNGLTRLRIVGLLGISAVAVGFWFVWRKLVREQSFAWLIERQLWTLAGALLLYALLPVDWLAMEYNVRQVLAGRLAPSVQFSVQPLSPEGALPLVRLLDGDHPQLRAGVRALLAQERERARRSSWTAPDWNWRRDWSAAQIAATVLDARLRPHAATLDEYANPAVRAAALQAFHDYVYQWY